MRPKSRKLKSKTSCGKFLNLAHYFPYDVKLRLLAHSRSFLANQKAGNAIVGAENLLKGNRPSLHRVSKFTVVSSPRRVLQLMNLTDSQLSQRGSEKLELAILSFFEQFRKMYVGDQAQKTSKVKTINGLFIFL